jgi:hypothetical protein
MTGIAAPLLASASVTIIGVVVQQPDALRWPGVSLALLALAAFLLVNAVQLGFLARRHVARPDEIAPWWPDLDQQALAQRIRRDREDDAALFAWWANYASVAYGLGVAVLWVAIGTALAPGENQQQVDWRWIAAAGAWATAVFETAWFIASRRKPDWFLPRRRARQRYLRR